MLELTIEIISDSTSFKGKSITYDVVEKSRTWKS
jgi:hypothetical protein